MTQIKKADYSFSCSVFVFVATYLICVKQIVRF